MKLNQIVFATATLLLWATAHGATITVTTTNDSGPGSLRAALAGAANGDTVDARSVTGSITLSHGELVVSNSVTILGPAPICWRWTVTQPTAYFTSPMQSRLSFPA